ncbi:hypothetical protein [Halodesulfurarchaeum formicicum]|nr:hypothetical protein [Halodesulfurarchaeum formicicum]
MPTILQSLPPNFWSVDVADVVSLLLTVGLFLVYFSMRNIQDEQNTIQRTQNRLMQRQTALMAANHQPRLTFDSHRGDDDTLKLSIDNSGEGPADNIHSQCVIYEQEFGGDGPQFKPGYQGAGTVVSSALNPMVRKPTTSMHDDKPPDMNKVGESTVEAGEMNILLDGVIKLKPFSGGSEPYDAPFSEVMQRLSREWNDVDHIAIDLFVFFTDVVGEEYGMHVESYSDIPLSMDLTFEEALERGSKHSRIGDPLTEDDAAAMIPLNPENMDFR